MSSCFEQLMKYIMVGWSHYSSCLQFRTHINHIFNFFYTKLRRRELKKKKKTTSNTEMNVLNHLNYILFVNIILLHSGYKTGEALIPLSLVGKEHHTTYFRQLLIASSPTCYQTDTCVQNILFCRHKKELGRKGACKLVEAIQEKADKLQNALYQRRKIRQSAKFAERYPSL